VVGPGGVLQGATLTGAERIIAMDHKSEKADLARLLGATDTVVLERDDIEAQVRELLPDGVDCAFDAIGHTKTTEAAIRTLAISGAAVLVGLPPAGTEAVFDRRETYPSSSTSLTHWPNSTAAGSCGPC
jgi:S-(hydroxymethyl)glutathione dehydrogenase/alcohol dehydrogenase